MTRTKKSAKTRELVQKKSVQPKAEKRASSGPKQGPKKESKKPVVIRLSRHPLLSGHVRTASLFKMKERPPFTAPPTGLFIDPFEDSEDGVAEFEVDMTEMRIEAIRASTESQYTNQTTPSSKVFRLCWVPPLAEQTTGGGDVKVDSRGMLLDVVSATVSFTNHEQQAIQVRANTPRALNRDLSLIGTRDCNLSVTIPPGATRRMNIKLGSNTFFSPFVYNAKGSDKLPLVVLVLCDFVVIIPDSLASGAANPSSLTVCKVATSVRYYANAEITVGTKAVPRPKFVLQNLSSLTDLFTVDAHLLTDGSLITSSADYYKPTVVQAELTAEKWMRLELVKRKGAYSYSYRLVYCSAKGEYHSRVQFRQFQSSDYRLSAPGFCSTFIQHAPGTTQPMGLTQGTATLMWDDEQEAWIMCSGRTPVASDVANPGADTPTNIIPATSPFFAFSVSPPSLGLRVVKGRQRLILRHEDDMVTGVVDDILAILDGATRVISVVSAMVAFLA